MNIVQRPHVDDSVLIPLIPDPLLRQILAARGVQSAQDLELSLNSLLHYRDLLHIDEAAGLTADAVEQGQKICVMGDYDVDGMTGASLGVRCLLALGLPTEKVSCQVPSRYDGGYGMSPKMVQAAKEAGAQFILTVDNGIGCHEAARTAKELGLTLVITDHHEPGPELPIADAIVNPKLKGDKFPSKHLSGVGVLFYVLIAVRAKLQERGWFNESRPAPVMGQFLDLVAIGTVGDVVQLDANNRRLVRAGLRRMQQQSVQPGVKALADIARVKLSAANVYNIAFDLCPRLNAAGRLKLSDNPALECLLCDDEIKAQELAQRLDLCNRRRGDYEKVFLTQAREDAQICSRAHSVVVYRPEWLSGLSGLMASRLKDQYARPCFVFAGDGEEITGSARSVPTFPLAKVLTEIDAAHPGLITRCGGHSMAAGATIRRESLEEFRELFEAAAAEYLQEGQESEIVTDGTLPEGYFNLNFARAIEQLGPWGQGYPEPLFDGVFIIEQARVLGGRNLRLRLAGGHSHINAIRFRATPAEKTLAEGMRVRAVFSLGVDRYYSTERLEVKLHAIEPV